LVGADRSKDIVVLRLLNLQVRPVSDAAAPLANHALACHSPAGRCCTSPRGPCMEVLQPVNGILISYSCLQEASC